MDSLRFVLTNWRPSVRVRILLTSATILLVLLHLLSVLAGFAPTSLGWPESGEQVEHLVRVSTSVSPVTAALLLVLLLLHGQTRFLRAAAAQRHAIRKSIHKQVVDWCRKADTPTLNPEDVAQLTSGPGKADWWHTKIDANAKRLSSLHALPPEAGRSVAAYCKHVHYELTAYPTELVYGIHFEFSDGSLNATLCQETRETLAVDRQYPALAVDQSVPKRPEWTYLCARVDLAGDLEQDLPKIATHVRHFVELALHTHDSLYGKDMVLRYLGLLAQG